MTRRHYENIFYLIMSLGTVLFCDGDLFGGKYSNLLVDLGYIMCGSSFIFFVSVCYHDFKKSRK